MLCRGGDAGNGRRRSGLWPEVVVRASQSVPRGALCTWTDVSYRFGPLEREQKQSATVGEGQVHREQRLI